MRASPLRIILILMAVMLAGSVVAAQPPGPPGGFTISTKNPNDIVRRGGNAEVLLNDDGSITMTSTGPGNDSPTTETVDAEDLEDVPDEPRRNRRIARTDDRYVTLYKLTTSGEWQVNIGPDSEGKVYVYIFTLDPRECIRSYQFDAEEKVEQFSGGCE